MMIEVPSKIPTLSKLISSAIPKAKIVEFLGLSPKTKEHKTVLLERLLELIEAESTEKSGCWKHVGVSWRLVP